MLQHSPAAGAVRAFRRSWPLGLALVATVASGAPGDTTRVSLTSDNAESSSGAYFAAISGDGRFVAFGSDALVPEDVNGVGDIFVRDRLGGVTTMVSIASDGSQGEITSNQPSISADGRHIFFISGATQLVADDTNGATDLFAHDRYTGVTTRVSVGSGGIQSNNYSHWPRASANGRYVAFSSAATNLVANDTNARTDVFVHDRHRSVTTRVSVASNGVQATSSSQSPSISADGRYVAFSSYASNLVAGDTLGQQDIFVHDRQTGQTSRVSVATNGEQGNGWSYYPTISGNGRYVVFESEASNLVVGDTNSSVDVFVHDRQAGITSRVSVASDGSQGNGASTSIQYESNPLISADGRFVAFASAASNLVPGDTNGAEDLFVRDRLLGVTTRVSVGSSGGEGNGASFDPEISADGRFVAFTSEASNLDGADANGVGDVFVHERAVPVPTNRIGLVVLPDLNGNSVGEVAELRGEGVLEIRDGGTGVLLQNLPALSAGFWPVAVKRLPDTDGNGIPELAVLATRQSDGRAVVEIRNLTGAPAVRQVWFLANHTPLALSLVSDDSDDNGVVEIAVLSRRDSDGRGLVEVKNAFGSTNTSTIWAAAGFTPLDLEIVPDADGNGVPEVAMLSARDSDGRIVVEVKNATGATNPRSVWFMAGNTALDLTVVGDADANGVPEVAVLSKRDSDGRLVAEVKNAAGATNPSAVWFAAGQTGVAIEGLGDADGNGVPELAVLSKRDSDGRVLVEVKNAAGATNARSLWYPVGYTPHDLAILPDFGGNGVPEAGVLLTRDVDGRLLIQSRNVAGTQSPRDYWFSP
jgi:Tol biopolymer transport system component